jgi:hypothetical protein
MVQTVQDVRTCLIWHTKGPEKWYKLYRMSEYSGFTLVNRSRNTLGPFLSDVGKLWCWIAQDPLYKLMAEIYLFFFSMITVAPLLKGHPYCNQECPYRRGDLSWGGQFTSILLRMCTMGGLWYEWPYKRGTTIIDYRPIYNVHKVYTIDWAYISDISHSMYHVIYI